MNQPYFSIIIPTYNRAGFIEKTVKSVLNQTYTNFELIVVDDGSTDNTKEIVTSINDKKIRYYWKENAERGAARNFGIKKAKGEYITFLDSDDLFYTNHLKEALKYITKNKPDVCFQGYEIINKNNKNKQVFPKQNINKLLLVQGNIMSCHGVFLKNEIAEQNLFNEDYLLSGLEDYELWLRISAQHNILHNPIITSCLINHENRSVLEFNKEKLIKKNILFLEYIFRNEFSSKYFKPHKNYIISNTYSYIALHLVLSNFKKDGIVYFYKSIKKRPSKLFTKRSLAIFKHLLLSK